MIEQAPLCGCGCGQPVKFKGGRWNKYATVRCACRDMGRQPRDRSYLRKAHHAWREQRNEVRRGALEHAMNAFAIGDMSRAEFLNVLDVREQKAYQRGYSQGRRAERSDEVMVGRG